jgi:2-polyprenyl-3-methyl-5-hydroxy-6-metoxy-1,4-benzoquinol methylase
MSPLSLERIYPGKDGDETLQLHLERYHFAGKHLLPGIIADIACGAGYGSHLLAAEYGKNIEKIIAADNNEDAVTYARTHYLHSLIDFRVADAYSFQSPIPLTTVVSLETIEHLSDPSAFVNNLSSQLISGGRFIASAPITPSMDANTYHLQDFTGHSFKKLFTNAGLKEVESMVQVQRFKPFKVLGKKQVRNEGLRTNLIGYYLTHPAKLLLRIVSTLRYGFSNRYLVVVFEKR